MYTSMYFFSCLREKAIFEVNKNYVYGMEMKLTPCYLYCLLFVLSEYSSVIGACACICV